MDGGTTIMSLDFVAFSVGGNANPILTVRVSLQGGAVGLPGLIRAEGGAGAEQSHGSHSRCEQSDEPHDEYLRR
jgi:hypothetical protein